MSLLEAYNKRMKEEGILCPLYILVTKDDKPNGGLCAEDFKRRSCGGKIELCYKRIPEIVQIKS